MRSAARAEMSELPADRAARLERETGLSTETAQLLAFRGELGDYFEAALASGADPAPAPQQLANWVSAELLGRLDDVDDPAQSLVTPAALAALVGLLTARQVTAAAGRTVLERLIAEGGEPQAIIEAEGLGTMDGGDELAGIVAAALEANPDAAQRVREGNAKAIGPIVGQVMRETKGRADGTEVSRLINEQLAG
ncbi:MAG: glutamyl-tRNA(Gln) amidotransferase, subunit [Solirubrobacterales bacterium]|nr:glutamyl-tRNA(Gln) amidotransferase, subunit [Solirubrobacterales bacterium]